jgi:hypothetical protein
MDTLRVHTPIAHWSEWDEILLSEELGLLRIELHLGQNPGIPQSGQLGELRNGIRSDVVMCSHPRLRVL